MTASEDLGKLLAGLEQQRDELRVRLHLAGLEAREEWARAEQAWEQFHLRVDEVRDAGAESSHDIGAALALLGEELHQTYRRLRKLF